MIAGVSGPSQIVTSLPLSAGSPANRCRLIQTSSLAGVPLTVGFLGKFMVFNVAVQHAISSGFWFLVVFAVLGATAGFYYYFKIIKSIYFHEPISVGDETLKVGSLSKFVISLLVALVLILGIFPNLIMQFL